MGGISFPWVGIISDGGLSVLDEETEVFLKLASDPDECENSSYAPEGLANCCDLTGILLTTLFSDFGVMAAEDNDDISRLYVSLRRRF
ncbi:hypothetical protein I7I50_07090 [Histoplasma capsulatum G186AR]|nr:hypothetical protein I7I50_07090 [Histoplasma capsulatum G186AR]